MNRRSWLVPIVLMMLTATTLLAQNDIVQQILDRSNARQSVTLGDIVYETDFSTNDGWDFADTRSRFVGVDDGVYRIEHDTRNFPMYGFYEDLFDNTVIVVDTTQLSDEPDNGYGVVCRADPDDEYTGYNFYISGDGYTRIFTYDDAIPQEIVTWRRESNINRGMSTNELIVVCNDDYLALYVNGELAIEATNSTFTRGRVGFSATSYVDDTSVNIAFSNLRIYETTVGAPSFVPETLDRVENYGIDWRATIAEFEGAGVIPSGGQLIFSESRAFMDGTVGADFYPLALNSSYADIVFGGTMNITLPANNRIQCGFLSRVNLDASDQVALGGFEMTIDEAGNLQVTNFGATSREDNFTTVELGLAIDKSIYVLYVLQADRATIYINGEAVLTDFEISDVAGFHGIILRTSSSGGRCEGRNIWAYAIPQVSAGVCEAVASGQVNQRSGPGTTFDRVGVLSANSPLRVVGQAMDDDNFVWWQLENDNWVREDVVTVSGDCVNIPEVEGG